jgi:hypothetical protein
MRTDYAQASVRVNKRIAQKMQAGENRGCTFGAAVLILPPLPPRASAAFQGRRDKMTNHPNRSQRTPFHVHAYPGGLLAKFRYHQDAQRVAHLWSQYWGSRAEVFDARDGGSIIGQYDKGVPTPEFQGRGDECYPGSTIPGKRASAAT